MMANISDQTWQDLVGDLTDLECERLLQSFDPSSSEEPAITEKKALTRLRLKVNQLDQRFVSITVYLGSS